MNLATAIQITTDDYRTNEDHPEATPAEVVSRTRENVLFFHENWDQWREMFGEEITTATLKVVTATDDEIAAALC